MQDEQKSEEYLSSYYLSRIPDEYFNCEMANECVKKDGWYLRFVPDSLKTKDLCKAALKNSIYALEFIPKSFLDKEMINFFTPHIESIRGKKVQNRDESCIACLASILIDLIGE